jgi:hypothetical protein
MPPSTPPKKATGLRVNLSGDSLDTDSGSELLHSLAAEADVRASADGGAILGLTSPAGAAARFDVALGKVRLATLAFPENRRGCCPPACADRRVSP